MATIGLLALCQGFSEAGMPLWSPQGCVARLARFNKRLCEGSGHRLQRYGQPEVGGVADGLHLFGGAAIDTILLSALRGDGSARRHAAFKDGVALVEDGRSVPSLVGDAGIARFVVLAAEVGGRWSCEFLKLSRSAPAPLRGKARAAWFRRWSALLSCAAARAHVLSMLEKRHVKVRVAERLHSQYSGKTTVFSFFRAKNKLFARHSSSR